MTGHLFLAFNNWLKEIKKKEKRKKEKKKRKTLEWHMVLYRIDNRKIFLKFSLWKSAYKIDNNTRSEAAVVRGWKKLTFFFLAEI